MAGQSQYRSLDRWIGDRAMIEARAMASNWQFARSREGLLLDAIAFFLPFSRLIEIRLVGNLFLHDILTPIVILLLVGQRTSLRPLRPLLIVLGVWLAGAVITDFYRHTPFVDYSRGWSKIVLFGLNAVMVWMLTKGQGRRLAIYTFSSGVALCLSAVITPEEADLTDPWKFGLGYGVALTVASLSMSSRLNRRFGGNIGSWMLAVVAIVSILQNSRSLFAICALAAAYSPLARWISSRPKWARRFSPLSFLAIIVAGLVVGQGLVAGYGSLAQSGFLGRDAQTKFLDQTKGNLNFLQGGRSESLVSLEAIADSPIFGHGSWAKDPYYLQLLLVKMREAGLPSPGTFYSVGVKTEFLIPTHSYLFGAWVESGILGVPIWIYAFFIAFQSLYAIIKIRGQPSALLSLVAFAMMWDVFFSPFASDARILKGVEICILIAAAGSLKKIGASELLRPQAPWRSAPKARHKVG
jgi:hypothetical protein